MRHQLFFIISIVFAMMFFAIPANAQWPKIMNDVIDTVKKADSVLDSVQSEKEQQVPQEPETALKPQINTDGDDTIATSAPNTANRIESKPSSDIDDVMAKNSDTEDATSPSVAATMHDTPEPENKIKSTSRPDPENATEEQVKEAESVYEECIENRRMSLWVDCECLSSKFLELRIERGPDKPKDLLVAYASQRTCRNVEGSSRLEYTRCMEGSSFNYYEFEPEDYCQCYAREWGKLYEESDGVKIDETEKGYLRARARAYCKEPDAYEKK